VRRGRVVDWWLYIYIYIHVSTDGQYNKRRAVLEYHYAVSGYFTKPHGGRLNASKRKSRQRASTAAHVSPSVPRVSASISGSPAANGAMVTILCTSVWDT
jgi:hypothetical protein